MNSDNIQVIAIGVAILAMVSFKLFKSWKQGRVLFGIKKIIDNLSVWLNLIIAAYVMIFGTHMVGFMADWSIPKMESSEGVLYWMYRSYPLAVALLTIFVVIKIFRMKWIKFNEKEKAWIKEDEAKNKDTFGIKKRLSNIPILKILVRDDDENKDTNID